MRQQKITKFYSAGLAALIWTSTAAVPTVEQGIQGVNPEVSQEIQLRSPGERYEGATSGESFSLWPENAVNVIRGEVVWVDADDQMITVKDIATGMQLTTRVADPSTLGSFAPGDRVRVTFGTDDKTTATSVVAEEDWKKE